MNKEPIALYIFRFVLGFAIFAMMSMLYWSSALLEVEMKHLNGDIEHIKNSLSVIEQEQKKTQLLTLQAIQESHRPSKASSETFESSKTINLPQSAFPNLLEEDPFYTTALPKLLGHGFKYEGVFHSAVVGKPDNLHPYSNWAQVAGWIAQCTVRVARNKFGKYETLCPDMAIKMEERKDEITGKVEYWIYLRDNVFWHPLKEEFFIEEMRLDSHFFQKHQVTAHDFKFNYDAVMNPYVQEAGAIAQRIYFSDIEEFRIVDDLTFVVRWKDIQVTMPDGTVKKEPKYAAKFVTGNMQPLAIFLYQYFPDGKKIVADDHDPNTYRTNSVWAQNFAQHWAKNIIPSCGPWIFDGMTDRQISFKRNPEHYFPLDVLAQGQDIEIKDSPDVIWQEFKTNKLDSYALRPDQLQEWETFKQSDIYRKQSLAGFAIERLDYLSRSYVYLGWNEAKPFFASKKIRQAMTMGIDRLRIINQNLNGLGIELTCPFLPGSSAYKSDLVPWPYDIFKARRLLEEEGWYDSDGDGIIDKLIDGVRVPFIFSLTYYVKNSTSKAICEYVATALSELNIKCNLNGVDIADLSAAFDDKSFDAILLGWSLGAPPEDPKQLWHSMGSKEKGSSNAIGFNNKEIDGIIDALEYETDKGKRIQLFHRFDEIIHDEAPYTFLYEPKTVFLYRRYLQNVFIPANRQDLVPGADVVEPEPSAFWLKR